MQICEYISKPTIKTITDNELAKTFKLSEELTKKLVMSIYVQISPNWTENFSCVIFWGIRTFEENKDLRMQNLFFTPLQMSIILFYFFLSYFLKQNYSNCFASKSSLTNEFGVILDFIFLTVIIYIKNKTNVNFLKKKNTISAEISTSEQVFLFWNNKIMMINKKAHFAPLFLFFFLVVVIVTINSPEESAKNLDKRRSKLSLQKLSELGKKLQSQEADFDIRRMKIYQVR